MWDMHAAVGQQQEQMPVFAHSPRWVKQTLIFPYLAGGDFVRWFRQAHPDEQPYGKLMPVSTSQILHPERYAAREVPLEIRFTATGAGAPAYTNNLGEFETRLVLEQAMRSEDEAEALASGWIGDRYGVFGAHAEALVWYVVWRTPTAAAAFTSGLARGWSARAEPGRTWRVEKLSLDGRPATVITDAPVGWAGWKHRPAARILSQQ
jgi:hypothetical protein